MDCMSKLGLEVGAILNGLISINYANKGNKKVCYQGKVLLTLVLKRADVDKAPNM